jgi:hypothetical protein
MVQLQHHNMMGRYNLGRQQHKEKQLSNLLAQSGDVAPQDREKFAGNVMAAGGLNEANVLRNVWANSDAQKRAAIQQDVEGLAKTLFTVKQNPQAWGRVRQEIIRAKPEYANSLPEQFDPAWADQKINEARSFEDLFQSGSDLPSDVQSTQWLMGQPEDVRALHLKNKRGDQVINLGGSQLVRDPMGRVTNTFAVTPKPQDMPGFKASVAGAQEGAKQSQQMAWKPKITAAVKMAEKKATSRGETLSELDQAKAAMPGLRDAVLQLKDLAPLATSTVGGKLWDMAVKQTGFGATDGATAKAKFTAIINNQVLPLLKPTFGAAFTVQEGESLKKAMGDADASPEEKLVQLDAFLAQKMRDIETKQRRLGGNTNSPESNDPLGIR